MLKKIPAALTPELIKSMMEMGDGDELIICGRNYPISGMGINRVFYINSNINELLADILKLLPLSNDTAGATMYFEEDEKSPICREYEAIIASSEEASKLSNIDRLDKYPFINRAERVYCAIVTTDPRPGCEVILTKGRA